MLIVRRPTDDSLETAGRPDVAIAMVLLCVAWLFSAWLGSTLLDSRVDAEVRLTGLGMAAIYYVGAFLLVTHGRRGRWRTGEIRPAVPR
jgi:hypothetical protein